MRSTPRELPKDWEPMADWSDVSKSEKKIKAEISHLENPANKNKNPRKLAYLKEALADLNEKGVYSDYAYEWTMP